MRDFTLYIYKKLLEALLENGYQFIRFEQYLSHSYAQQQSADNEAISKLSDKYIILRHDVDLKAQNSLRTLYVKNEGEFCTINQQQEGMLLKIIRSKNYKSLYYEKLNSPPSRFQCESNYNVLCAHNACRDLQHSFG